jgi:hypothetical protein
MPCHANAAPIPRCAETLRSCFQNNMVVAWHERSMACVNQTRPHSVNQMGKTQCKPLAARHGRGTAWARHGNGMLCVISLKCSHLLLSSVLLEHMSLVSSVNAFSLTTVVVGSFRSQRKGVLTARRRDQTHGWLNRP